MMKAGCDIGESWASVGRMGLEMWRMNLTASEVVWRRSVQMASGSMSSREATRMLTEKAVAFVEGAAAATREAAQGHSPVDIASAAMEPAWRRASANARRLRQ